MVLTSELKNAIMANCKLAKVQSGIAISAQFSSRNMLYIPPSGGRRKRKKSGKPCRAMA
jgi:hypothetical protein